MSWHYSLALVEESLEEGFSDGDASVLSNSTSTPDLFSSHGKTMEASSRSQYGMTSQRLTDDLGEALLMWFQAASRARTSAQPGKGEGSQVADLDSGWKWRESSMKYDRDTCLWKTRQCSLLEDSELFSETWPRWGLMRDGECWELPMSARPIFERESGLLPTLTASSYGSCQGGSAGREGQKNRPSLQTMARNGLLPTLTCHDRKGKSGETRGKNAQGGETLTTTIGGNLSPMWSEWFMGFPTGWTDLKPLGTDKSHNAQPKHGEF